MHCRLDGTFCNVTWGTHTHAHPPLLCAQPDIDPTKIVGPTADELAADLRSTDGVCEDVEAEGEEGEDQMAGDGKVEEKAADESAGEEVAGGEAKEEAQEETADAGGEAGAEEDRSPEEGAGASGEANSGEKKAAQKKSIAKELVEVGKMVDAYRNLDSWVRQPPPHPGTTTVTLGDSGRRGGWSDLDEVLPKAHAEAALADMGSRGGEEGQCRGCAGLFAPFLDPLGRGGHVNQHTHHGHAHEHRTRWFALLWKSPCWFL